MRFKKTKTKTYSALITFSTTKLGVSGTAGLRAQNLVWTAPGRNILCSCQCGFLHLPLLRKKWGRQHGLQYGSGKMYNLLELQFSHLSKKDHSSCPLYHKRLLDRKEPQTWISWEKPRALCARTKLVGWFSNMAKDHPGSFLKNIHGLVWPQTVYFGSSRLQYLHRLKKFPQMILACPKD